MVLLGPHATTREELLASYYNDNVAGGVTSFAEAFQVLSHLHVHDYAHVLVPNHMGMHA